MLRGLADSAAWLLQTSHEATDTMFNLLLLSVVVSAIVPAFMRSGRAYAIAASVFGVMLVLACMGFSDHVNQSPSAPYAAGLGAIAVIALSVVLFVVLSGIRLLVRRAQQRKAKQSP